MSRFECERLLKEGFRETVSRREGIDDYGESLKGRGKVVSEGRKSTRGLFQVSLLDTSLVRSHFLCSSSSVFAT